MCRCARSLCLLLRRTPNSFKQGSHREECACMRGQFSSIPKLLVSKKPHGVLRWFKHFFVTAGGPLEPHSEAGSPFRCHHHFRAIGVRPNPSPDHHHRRYRGSAARSERRCDPCGDRHLEEHRKRGHPDGLDGWSRILSFQFLEARRLCSVRRHHRDSNRTTSKSPSRWAKPSRSIW